MNAAFARIILRYLAMALVMWGWLAPADRQMLASDPELAGLLEIGIGLSISLGTEAWYWLAKRMGWST
jgi:hypothetical protein